MHDLRDAVRSLRSTPVVSLMAILSLALGIGANTAIFSILDSLFLRTLPVRDPHQLRHAPRCRGAPDILVQSHVGRDPRARAPLRRRVRMGRSGAPARFDHATATRGSACQHAGTTTDRQNSEAGTRWQLNGSTRPPARFEPHSRRGSTNGRVVMALICIGCAGRSRSIGSSHACSTRPSLFATVGCSKAVTPSRCDSTWRDRQRTST